MIGNVDVFDDVSYESYQKWTIQEEILLHISFLTYIQWDKYFYGENQAIKRVCSSNNVEVSHMKGKTANKKVKL